MIQKILSNGKNKLENKAVWLIAGLFLVLGLSAIVLSSKTAQPSNVITSARKDFAKCLNSRGYMMFGDDTCEHCRSQKKMFGDDFAEITYVNCAFEIDRCREKQISAYPVWVKNDNKYTGVQSFADLSRISGCPIPK